MHVSKQTRTLGQAATERLTLVQGNPPNREAFLSIRLWNIGPNGETAPLYWDSGTPAVCLTADLIAASEGEPVSSDSGVLVTSFRSDHLAISAARRLQWAVQGFSESRDLQGISVAVLVHSAEELSTGPEGDALRSALDHATGGQILLTEKASQFFEDLPGFASQTLDGTGLRELQWRSNATRSSDEQWMTNVISQQGLEEQLAEPQAPAEVPEQTWSSRSIDDDERPSGSLFSNPKMLWIIGGACAAALALGAVLFITRSGDKQPPLVADTHQTVVNPQNAGTGGTQQNGLVSPTSGDTGTTVQNPPSEHPAEISTTKTKSEREREDKKHKKDQQPGIVSPEPKQVPTPDPAPPPVVDRTPKPTRGCDIENGQISSYLARADKALGSGNYSNAKRLFNEVLGCEPGNAHAREGLAKANEE
jgi:hypothetical protein